MSSSAQARAFCQRLDALDRARRGDSTGVLPRIGSETGLTLRQYLSLAPPAAGLTKKVAAGLGVTTGTVRKWAAHHMPIPPHALIDLARITQGQVTRV